MRLILGLLLISLAITPVRSYAAAPCGDINADGVVNISDVTTLLRLVVLNQALTTEQIRTTDLNRDGKVNIADATLLLRGIVHTLDITGLCASSLNGPILTTVLGDPSPMANGIGADARFQAPSSVAFDSSGNLIVSDLNNHAIRMVTPSGAVSTIAGNGVAGYRDGPVAQALIGDVYGVKVGPDNAIYFTDLSNLRIRKVSPDRSTITTLAGAPTLDASGFATPGHKDGPGNVAQFNSPIGLAVDANSNVFVADSGDNSIRQITPDGTVSTVAGNEQAAYSDGNPLGASFDSPSNLAFAQNGNLYISDFGNELIRVLSLSQTVPQVSTFAGNPQLDTNMIPLPGYSDGPGTTAQFGSPRGLAFGGSILYLADSDFFSFSTGTANFTNNRIRAIDAAGNVTTVAGNDAFGSNNGKGAVASFNQPYDLAALPDGTLYIADLGNDLIRKVAPDGTVSTLAGKSAAGYLDGPAAQAQLLSPEFITGDGSGNFYIGDYGNNRIRKLSKGGQVTTVIGQDLVNGNGDYLDGPVKTAKVNGPTCIAVAKDGSLFFTDRENHVIRKIDTSGNVTTFAGTGQAGFADGPGKQAQFDRPRYLQFGPDGSLYVSDTYNHRIRKVTPDGTVSTIAGGGPSGDAGQNYVDGPAATARFAFPQGMAIAADLTIYVADIGNQMIRKIDPKGNVTTFAGNPPLDANNLPVGGYMDGPGMQAQFSDPGAIVIQPDGSLLVSDRSNNRIRKITADGTVSTVAGLFDSGFWDGPITIARLNGPFGLAFDTDGNLLIAEEYNNRVRRLTF